MTPNEVVSWNVLRARALRGWTQEEAAQRLEPYIGARWSKASYSAAELAHKATNRPRRFTADELYALSRAFELPITFFLIPPSGADVVGHPNSTETVTAPEFLELVFATDEPTRKNMQGTLQQLELRDVLRTVQRWAAHAKAVVDEVEAGVVAALEAAEDLSDPKRRRRALVALGERDTPEDDG
jgi:transcriptional regulator with XRE-family HTH domain